MATRPASTDDAEWQRNLEQDAINRQRGAAQQSQGSQNPSAAARGIREESLSSRPKVGSNSLQRAGGDPNYHVGPQGPTGIMSPANSLTESTSKTPQAQWDKVFAPVVPNTSHMAGPTHMTQPASPSGTVAAPPPGALGANPVVPGSAPASPAAAPSRPASAPWTGPSTAPRLGPPRAEPWTPHGPVDTFTVPTPLTGPGGNAATDSAAFNANLSMAQPGGANFWSHPSTPAPQSEFQPSANVAALNAVTGTGQVGHTPYGDIRSVPPVWNSTAPQPDWSSLRDTSPAESVPNGASPAYSLPLSSAETVGPSSTPGPSATPGPSSGMKPKFSQNTRLPNQDAPQAQIQAPQMEAY